MKKLLLLNVKGHKLKINTIYTPIFHIGKILLSLNCFNSNSNRNITELVIDT
jgi:hypothetical protein